MDPLRRSTLQGIWGTVLLPLDARDSIDWTRLADEIEFVAASDLHGVYAHGTAGEFHTLSDAEYDRVSGMLADACTRRGKPFQLGASHPVGQVSLDRIARARGLHPGAFQVVFPDWVGMNESECEAFVHRVAEIASPVPLVLYNPPHAKTRATPELLARLLDGYPSLIGVKVADGDACWYETMSDVLRRCAVFVPGHRMATGRSHGAAGSYSNVAALSPAGAVRWYELAATDPAAAADIERRIAEFFAEHIAPLQRQGLSNPALDKFLTAVGGWCDVGVRTRWPYEAAAVDLVEPARRTVHTLVPELFGG